MGSSHVVMNFYTITTASDGVIVETLLHENISGCIETRQQILSEKLMAATFVQLLIFYPDKNLLTGIVTGMKATDGINTYSVQYEESYSSHQEIYLRKNNL